MATATIRASERPTAIDWQSISYGDLKDGIPVSFVARVLDQRLLLREDVERVIPTRTLERRRANNEDLKTEEIDGLLRLLRVRAHALRVFEDISLADEWLRSANPALRDERPMDMARTDVGAREVEGVLGRLEHGVYA